MPLFLAGSKPSDVSSVSLFRTSFAVTAGVCFLLFAAGVYWAVLLSSHQDMQRYTQAQAWLRVTQMSRAVSAQVGAMLSGMDYTLRGMVSDYESGDGKAFRRAVASVQEAYPSGTIVQVAVADASGRVVYSSLDGQAQSSPGISIFDREHFQAHLQDADRGLFVGRPVQGRVSKQWSIQLSRALHQDGKFAGVLVLSLSPEYISRQLQAIFENPRDVILLLREGGTYLARSQHQAEVLGHDVPEERLALFLPGMQQGTYEALATPDGIQRMYAWTRVSGFPLLVSAGLDSQAVYGPLQATIRASLLRNGAGTALICLGGLLTAWLAVQRRRVEVQRVQSEQRFMRLAQEVPGGLFQYGVDAAGRHVLPFTNPGFYAIHCLDAPETEAGLPSLAQRVHADDVDALRASIEAAVRTRGTWEHKYRIDCPDGSVHWLHGHAKPQSEPDGTVLWHGYILDVTRDEALQAALRQSEERLRLTFGAVRDGLWQWDCAHDQFLWDARCYEMLGLDDQAPGAFTLAELVARLHPLDQQRAQARLRQHLAQGESFRVEVRLRTAAGTWRWVESRGEVTQRDSAGQPLRMLGTHTDIHERVEQERLVSALLDRGSALVLVASPSRDVVYANERAAECFGIAAGRMPKPVSFQALHTSAERFDDFAELYKVLKLQGTVRTEWMLCVAAGAPRWFDMQGALLDPEDPDGNVIWTLFDVDARRQAEAGLAHAQQRVEALIEHFPSGILVTDGAGRTIVAANQMLVAMMRLPFAADTLIGEPVSALLSHLPAQIGAVLQVLPGDAAQGVADPAALEPGRAVYALPDERHLEIERLQLRKDVHLLGLCWVFHDVTDYKQRESRLEALASTDALTGVSNRRAFIGRMEQELEHQRLGLGSPSALIMLDIDHFKRVNDTYGHAVGDVVLKHLTATVSRELRKNDLLGRLGGEEFAVLLAGVDEPTALRRAEHLRLAIERQAVSVSDLGPIRFTVSLGICLLQQTDTSVEECLERADAALYHSKRTGRNRVSCWSPAMQTATGAR